MISSETIQKAKEILEDINNGVPVTDIRGKPLMESMGLNMDIMRAEGQLTSIVLVLLLEISDLQKEIAGQKEDDKPNKNAKIPHVIFDYG
jgi:hypothetical protein